MDFLKHTDLDFRTAGANTLAKFSEQCNTSVCPLCVLLKSIVAEFQESIGIAIPQIMDLLEATDRDVCTAGANTLAKLSEQGTISVCAFCVLRKVLQLHSESLLGLQSLRS